MLLGFGFPSLGARDSAIANPDVVFCEGTDEAYIDQICDYTEDAEHDDAPDSLASLIQRNKMVGREYEPIFG